MTDKQQIYTLKILHVISSWYNGGSARLVTDWIEYSEDQSVKHYLAIVQKSPSDHPLPRLPKNSVFHLDYTGKWSATRTVLALQSLIRSNGIDVVQTYLDTAALIGGLAGRMARVPIVGTLVNSVPDPALGALARLPLPRLRKTYFGLCTHLLAISPSPRRMYAKALGLEEKSIGLVTHGLSTERLDKVRRISVEKFMPERLRHLTNSRMVLVVGRLHPEKGAQHIVEVGTKVIERRPDAVVVVAGDGLLRSNLEKAVKSIGLSDNFVFLGRVSYATELMRMSDVCFSCSPSEAYLGYANLEALYLGAPLAVFDLESFEGMLVDRHSAMLAPLGDIDSQASNIVSILDDPKLAATLSENGHQLAKKRFGAKQSAKSLEEYHRAILA